MEKKENPLNTLGVFVEYTKLSALELICKLQDEQKVSNKQLKKRTGYNIKAIMNGEIDLTIEILVACLYYLGHELHLDATKRRKY